MLSRGVPSQRYPLWGCFEKDQAEALANYGHKVVVISVDARFEKKRGSLGLQHNSIDGVEYYNYTMLPGVFFSKFFGEKFYRNNIRFKIVYRLYKLIEKKYGKPDIIYSQFYWNTYSGQLLKKKTGIPLVAIEHLGRFRDKILDSKTLNFAKTSFLNSNKVIAVSSNLGESLKNHFGCDYDVVHNTYGKEFGNFKESSDIINDKFIIITTARLVYGKGLDVLINALSLSNIPQQRWELRIIGDGPEKSNLMQLSKNSNLDSNIFFLGEMNKNNVANELKKANLFILPSRGENFSVSLVEALSMGLPVISTDCGGARDCINDKNGLIVPIDDVDTMKNAIEWIFYQYHTFDREEIFNDCERKFSPHAIAAQLTKIFEDTIQECKKGKELK